MLGAGEGVLSRPGELHVPDPLLSAQVVDPEFDPGLARGGELSPSEDLDPEKPPEPVVPVGGELVRRAVFCRRPPRAAPTQPPRAVARPDREAVELRRLERM